MTTAIRSDCPLRAQSRRDFRHSAPTSVESDGAPHCSTETHLFIRCLRTHLTLSAIVRTVYVHPHAGCGCGSSPGMSDLTSPAGRQPVATPAEHLQHADEGDTRPRLRAVDPATEPFGADIETDDEGPITIDGAVEMFFGALRLAPRSKKTYR